jgi:hypothetical protein
LNPIRKSEPVGQLPAVARGRREYDERAIHGHAV